MLTVHTFEGGEREFSFIRNPGADMMLTEHEVNIDLLQKSKIFHFGTLSSTHEGVRKATRFAVDTAIANGALISFDPNLREPLWSSLDDANNRGHRRPETFPVIRCAWLSFSAFSSCHL